MKNKFTKIFLLLIMITCSLHSKSDEIDRIILGREMFLKEVEHSIESNKRITSTILDLGFNKTKSGKELIKILDIELEKLIKTKIQVASELKSSVEILKDSSTTLSPTRTKLIKLCQKLIKSSNTILLDAKNIEENSLYYCYLVGIEHIEQNQNYDLAFKCFQHASEHGHAKSQLMLAGCYGDGLGVDKNEILGTFWLYKAANQDNPLAQFYLASNLFHGSWTKKNIDEGVSWLKKSAQLGNPDAQHQLANEYIRGKYVQYDLALAYKWYRKAAEQGHAEAQYDVGICFRDGESVSIDFVQMVFWFQKSAEQGFANAQNNLGNCYMVGQGIAQDVNLGLEWITKAANQEHADAQAKLGMFYLIGKCVEGDKNAAKHWLNKAALNGNQMAIDAIKDTHLMALMDEKNASKSDTPSNHHNDKLCGNVQTTELNTQDPLEQLKKSAMLGDIEAQFTLGVYYRDGEHVGKNNSEAFKWFLKAAQQGHCNAEAIVGSFYAKGLGVEQNEDLAKYWFGRAAFRGHPMAIDSLKNLNTPDCDQRSDEIQTGF